jgi:pimeloyl-ACP methyl ester carboxylesterase
MAWNERALHVLARVSPRLVGPAFWLAGLAARRRPKHLFGFFATACSPSDLALLADPAVRAVLRRIFSEAVRGGTSGVVEDWAALSRRPWGFSLGEVRVPTLLMFGDADRFVPVGHGRDVARRMPGARVVELPGEGHLLGLAHRREIFSALGASR